MMQKNANYSSGAAFKNDIVEYDNELMPSSVRFMNGNDNNSSQIADQER
jgi:hypothetical protein